MEPQSLKVAAMFLISNGHPSVKVPEMKKKTIMRRFRKEKKNIIDNYSNQIQSFNFLKIKMFAILGALKYFKDFALEIGQI